MFRTNFAGYWLVVGFLLIALGVASAFRQPGNSAFAESIKPEKPSPCTMVGFDEEEHEPIRIC